ncbi:MAG: malate transporter [Cyanobacteria bacterium M_surface_10_m2_179]|nr:malate transporter [Cyanobacteria bacterium M_surface_10_m2_179]
MLQLLLELAPCLIGGMALGRLAPQLPTQLAPPLLRWGVPISLVGLLLKGGLHNGTGEAALFTLVLTAGGLLLTQRWPWLQRALPVRSLQLGSMVGNTAYFGLPVALALLPPQALSFSITYDLVGTLVTWSLGPLLLNGERAQPLQLLRQLLRTPVLQAVVVAVPLLVSPWHEPIAQTLWWPARLVLWLMLLLVGMRLGLLLGEGGNASSLRPALVIKLLALPALALLATGALGWPAVLRDALVLQAAAPTAMSVLLLAEACPQQSRECIPAAQLVLWSTLLSLVSVPLWWWLLNQPLLQATVAM